MGCILSSGANVAWAGHGRHMAVCPPLSRCKAAWQRVLLAIRKLPPWKCSADCPAPNTRRARVIVSCLTRVPQKERGCVKVSVRLLMLYLSRPRMHTECLHAYRSLCPYQIRDSIDQETAVGDGLTLVAGINITPQQQNTTCGFCSVNRPLSVAVYSRVLGRSSYGMTPPPPFLCTHTDARVRH